MLSNEGKNTPLGLLFNPRLCKCQAVSLVISCKDKCETHVLYPTLARRKMLLLKANNNVNYVFMPFRHRRMIKKNSIYLRRTKWKTKL